MEHNPLMFDHKPEDISHEVDDNPIENPHFTIWLFNSLPWKITMFKNGKPSISIRAIYTVAKC